MTVHVVTVHHRDDRWIDIQLRFLHRYLPEAVVWASLEGISEDHHCKFEHVIPSLGGHAGKLNLLSREVCASAADDDLIVFLDGDAMPIRPILSPIEAWLTDHDIAAVQRLENAGDLQPHPCFAVTRVAVWREQLGDWSSGYSWRNDSGEQLTDVGGNLLRDIEHHGLKWLPLHRSNAFNLHPLFFGVYANVLYHHGAGFRHGESRIMRKQIELKTNWIRFAPARKFARKRAWNAVNHEIERNSNALIHAATQGDEFYRVLEGRS